MSDPTELKDMLLARLNAESDEISRQLDELVGEMETVPAAERNGEHWDALTSKFLELQAKDRDLAKQMISARAALPDPKASSRKH